MDLGIGQKNLTKIAKDFSEAESLDPVSAKALMDTVAYQISRGNMLSFIREYPELAVKFIGVCVRELMEAYLTVNGMEMKNLKQRFYVALLKLARIVGYEEGNDIIMNLPLKPKDLGEMVGVPQKSFERFMSELKREGIAETGKGKIVIHDMGRLKLLVEGG